MKPSRKNELITIKKEPIIVIGMGLVFLALAVYGWGVVILSNRFCGSVLGFTIGFDILNWLGVFVVYGGYGAFMGWMGYRDVTSNKKLSIRTVILTIIGLLVGGFYFLIPVCG